MFSFSKSNPFFSRPDADPVKMRPDPRWELEKYFILINTTLPLKLSLIVNNFLKRILFVIPNITLGMIYQTKVLHRQLRIFKRSFEIFLNYCSSCLTFCTFRTFVPIIPKEDLYILYAISNLFLWSTVLDCSSRSSIRNNGQNVSEKIYF